MGNFKICIDLGLINFYIYDNINKKGISQMSKKLRFQDEMEITNQETGEVQNKVRNRTYVFKNEPNYIRLYTEGIMMIGQITKLENKMLCLILKYADYGNEISLTTERRKKIAKELGIKAGHFNKNLSNIVKSDLLIQRGIGEYMLNPFVFGKGKWDHISALRKEMKAS